MDGRCLEVQLTGRNATDIEFIRDSDGAYFVYPIGSLSEATRSAIMEFPESGIDDPFPPQSGSGRDEGSKAELALLQEKLKAVRLEYRESRSNGRRRQLRREWQLISEEIKGLEIAPGSVAWGLDEMYIDGLNTEIARLEWKLKNVREESRMANSDALRRRLRLDRELIADKITALEMKLYACMAGVQV